MWTWKIRKSIPGAGRIRKSTPGTGNSDKKDWHRIKLGVLNRGWVMRSSLRRLTYNWPLVLKLTEVSPDSFFILSIELKEVEIPPHPEFTFSKFFFPGTLDGLRFCCFNRRYCMQLSLLHCSKTPTVWSSRSLYWSFLSDNCLRFWDFCLFVLRWNGGKYKLIREIVAQAEKYWRT